jgi:SAM-dependent methyltransferase
VGDPGSAAELVGRPALTRWSGDRPRDERRRRHYSAPRLYEIAFDLNRKAEVDFLVHCFRRYARRPVRRVLDIACGTGPHLVRLADRGYRMVGLDLSPRNIAFVRERLAARGHAGETVLADMTDFRLSRPVDAAICMQDSQGHLLSNAELVAHLRAVARTLAPGGLYVFDRYMASSWIDPARRWSWSRRRGRLIVRASFSALEDIDPVSQIFRERMTLEAVENGVRRVYRQTHLSRMVFPQELRALVELAGGLEFVHWFFGFKPHQFLERSRHPLLMIVVLRKRSGRDRRGERVRAKR